MVAFIYVHYNSKKFKIGGERALLTLFLAVIGLPVYAHDLYKLKHLQDFKRAKSLIESTITRICVNCGRNLSNMPSDIKNCPYCQEKLKG